MSPHKGTSFSLTVSSCFRPWSVYLTVKLMMCNSSVTDSGPWDNTRLGDQSAPSDFLLPPALCPGLTLLLPFPEPPERCSTRVCERKRGRKNAREETPGPLEPQFCPQDFPGPGNFPQPAPLHYKLRTASLWDFPDGPVVESLPSDRHGLDTWSGN